MVQAEGTIAIKRTFKASVLQSNLEKALGAVNPFIVRNAGLPICKTVKITVEDNRIKIEATDLEKYITTWVDSLVDEEGSICVAYGTLAPLVKTLGEDNVHLECDDTGLREPVMSIKAGSNEATMSGMRVEEYPPVPKVSDGVSVIFDPDEFQKAVRRVMTVFATDDARPVLTGCLLVVGPEGYTVVAADGFRLAVQKGGLIDPPKETTQVIIPGRTLVAVEKLLKGCENPVEIQFSENGNLARFVVNGTSRFEIVTNTINGTYPDYTCLIPTESTWGFIVDPGMLRQAMDTTAVYASSGNNIVRFRAKSGTGSENVPAAENTQESEYPENQVARDTGVIELSSKAEDVGDVDSEVTAYSVYGLDAEGAGMIAFNYKYLSDVLRICNGMVQMGATTRSSPSIWQMPNDPSYICVVMPMFTNWA